MKLIYLFLLVAISGCSQIVSNSYYSRTSESGVWRSELEAGKRADTKSMPSRDRETISIKIPGIEFRVSADYQEVEAWGPLLFPVIPVSGSSDEQLAIWVEVNCQSCAYDFLKLEATIGESAYLPSSKETFGNSHLLKYPLRHSDTQELRLNFNELEPKVPDLYLRKQKGESFFVIASL